MLQQPLRLDIKVLLIFQLSASVILLL